MSLARTLLPLLMTVCLAACGDQAPEQKLAEAKENLEQAERETVLARREVERLRSRVEERAARVEAAERELADAQAELLAAAERADRRVTDVALFRTIQTRLLDEPELEPFAIRAVVDARIVTLEGELDRNEHAQRAIEIAEEVFGVLEVHSRLRVGEPERAAGAG